MNHSKFIETLGIDLIPYAIGILKLKSDKSFEPTKFSEIKEQLQGLNGKELDDALIYCKELFNEETSRGDKIEGKAYNLIGVTGISAAFVTGISGLLPKESQPNLSLSLFCLLITYIFIVVSLTLTILLASRVIIVGDYKYSYPDIADVFKMGSQTLLETKRDRLSSYLFSYAKNSQIHNIKATYLIGSQVWFRNSVILFLALAFVLIPSIFNSTANSPQILPTGTPTISQTLIANPATSTIIAPSLTISPTITARPSETQTPKPTYTITPVMRPNSVTPTPNIKNTITGW